MVYPLCNIIHQTSDHLIGFIKLKGTGRPFGIRAFRLEVKLYNHLDVWLWQDIHKSFQIQTSLTIELSIQISARPLCKI